VRGYFGIGIYAVKTGANVGTLWRSAYQLGAAFIFTIGKRYPRQASDTVKAWRHVPLFEYQTFDDFMLHRPNDCPLIGIEMGGRTLGEYHHQERSVYLLGAEDGGLPKDIQSSCQTILSIPSVRTESYNVAVAGSIVMYDRIYGGQRAKD
jgi:tRNA (guanosine-2'-O-)-methyltransferase